MKKEKKRRREGEWHGGGVPSLNVLSKSGERKRASWEGRGGGSER